MSGLVQSQGLPDINFYGVEDFPGSRQNWAVAQDSTGAMFFGNSSGILKYSGIEWTFIHLPINDVVRALLKGSDGNIYYTSLDDFGVLKSDSLSNFYAESFVSKLPEGKQTGFGTVWDVKEYRGAIFFQADHHIFVLDNDSLRVIESDTHLRRLHFFEDKLITTKRGTGLVSVEEDTLLPILDADPFREVSPYVVEKVGKNYLFLSRENGVHLYEEGEFQMLESSVSDSLIKHWPYRATKINNNEIAVATVSGGVYLIGEEGKINGVFTTKEGLNTNVTYDVFLDDEENLWVALDNGLTHLLINKPNYRIDVRKGYQGLSTGIVEFRGKVYAGTTEGLFEIDFITGAIKKINTPFSRVINLRTDKSSLIVNTEDGVYVKKSEVFLRTGLSGVHRIRLDHLEKDTFYISQNNSVSKVSYPEFEAKKIYEADADRIIEDFIFYKNELWFTTSDMQIFRTGNFSIGDTNYSMGLVERGEIEFFEVLRGQLVVGTTNGLFYFDEAINQFKRDSTYNDAEIVRDQVNAFKACGTDSVWFRVNRKVKQASKKDNKWETRSTPFQAIGFEETVSHITCIEDEVWFGTSNGIDILQNNSKDVTSHYKTNITGIYINRDSLIYGGFGEPQKPIVLPYANNELRFNYAAASYVAPDRNQYQVKLEGFDSDWSTWTYETQKDYTNIPEGNYIFRVRSKNVYDVAGIADAIPFEILPPWYRTWWAYLLYTFTIAGILYLAYKIRINQILRVQRIRNNIASDLHDEVSATLSSISYFAEAIKSDKVKKDKNRFVNLIANSADDAKEKITDIVWAINPEHDDWPAFLSKCRRFTSDLLESKEMEYSLKIDEFIPGKLDMQLRQHLWLIFKEMVTNAVRHSKASQLDVIMKYEEGELKLVVQDNGEGMDVDSVRKGNGLVNIHKRAEQINAEISLKTSEGFGTRWMLKVPL
ncbi:ATP-binding protein [Gracilimonas sp.]|uniref:sensor histidine kinase n=1 Tax=Gracilimonas sp. TaxID=1974203 RepID=UPI003BAAD7A7